MRRLNFVVEWCPICLWFQNVFSAVRSFYQVKSGSFQWTANGTFIVNSKYFSMHHCSPAARFTETMLLGYLGCDLYMCLLSQLECIFRWLGKPRISHRTFSTVKLPVSVCQTSNFSACPLSGVQLLLKMKLFSFAGFWLLR